MNLVEKIAGKTWENTAKSDAKRIALQKPTPGLTQVTDIAYLPDGIAAICWTFTIRRARPNRCRW